MIVEYSFAFSALQTCKNQSINTIVITPNKVAHFLKYRTYKVVKYSCDLRRRYKLLYYSSESEGYNFHFRLSNFLSNDATLRSVVLFASAVRLTDLWVGKQSVQRQERFWISVCQPASGARMKHAISDRRAISCTSQERDVEACSLSNIWRRNDRLGAGKTPDFRRSHVPSCHC